MFVCEFMQDIAEFDSSTIPAKVTLYQLKKKENGYWKTSDLTGQTDKDKTPKPQKPVSKLYKSVQAFKSVQARGAFVSNAKFEIELSSDESSVNSEVISLSDLADDHSLPLRKGFGQIAGIPETDVDLSLLELKRVLLHVDDLQRHTTGIMADFLTGVAPEHVSQATSLVDTLYVRIKAASRRTDKSKTWADLVQRRGFGKLAFKMAVESLAATPDAAGSRRRLFERLAQGWNSRRTDRVAAALTRCAREKILVGTGNRWSIDREVVRAACEYADAKGKGDEDLFAVVEQQLIEQLPELSLDEISALAIYEISEWSVSQILA